MILIRIKVGASHIPINKNITTKEQWTFLSVIVTQVKHTVILPRVKHRKQTINVTLLSLLNQETEEGARVMIRQLIRRRSRVRISLGLMSGEEMMKTLIN